MLPPELLTFAENIFRRFPEEFLTLGAPGLEQIFDLRPDGSRSRRISETPSEKTVEITIRRWQPASLSPMLNYMPSYPPPMPMYSSPSVMEQRRADSNIEAHMTSQLARLEAALSTLAPQIEAAALSRPKIQAQTEAGMRVPTGGTPALSCSGSPSTSKNSPLRDRRRFSDIRIEPPVNLLGQRPSHEPAVKPDSPQAPEAAEIVRQSSLERSTSNQDGRDRARPAPVATGRMVPNAGDPESPRSPGRYSAWK